jgi:hypothetical protein
VRADEQVHAHSVSTCIRSIEPVRFSLHALYSHKPCSPTLIIRPSFIALRSSLQILDKLEPVVKEGAIICLQEVSMTWGCELHTWFQTRRSVHAWHL